MNNKLMKVNIILWAVVLVVALGAFSVLTFADGSSWLGNSFSFEGGNRTTFVTVKEETFSKDIDNFSLNWISGEVQVLIGDDASIKVVQTASPDLPERLFFRSKTTSDRLTIDDGRQHQNFNFLGGKQYATDITVYLPEKQYRALAIETVSADTLLETFSAKSLTFSSVSGNMDFSGSFEKIDLDTVSGKITGSDLTAEELESNTVSGDIRCEGSFGSFEGDTTSGNLTMVSSICPKEITLSTISGNCNLSIPENDGFTLSFDKVSGDFKSDFAYQIQSKDNFVYKDGSADFSVDTVSGDCTLSKSGGLATEL